MRVKVSIFISVMFILFAAGCVDKEWDRHYNEYPETVDQNVWEAMQNDSHISKFVEILKESKIDTLFDSDNSFTLFMPSNEAVDNYLGHGTFNDVILKYHFCTHFINPSTIIGKRQVQTLTKKFSLFERVGDVITVDGITTSFQSPLYLNGRYFVIDEVVEPKPNLYEYFDFENPVLSAYIDSQDTIILDPEKSKPLGFDDDGNTVYDTVSVVENKFEWKYFPVKHEFRSKSATIVFPKTEDYQNALNVMADNLGDLFQDYRDIPIEWQNEVLVPHLLKHGVFLNRIEEEEFVWDSPTDTVKFLNVLGDSVVIDYVPVDKALCSNGYAYNYQEFEIPDSLYSGESRYEGEWLLKQTGVNRYSWHDFVSCESSTPMEPLKQSGNNASNDTIMAVRFPSGYEGTFNLEFQGPRLFPRKYILLVRTNMYTGGIYDIYVNGELARTFDYYEYRRRRGVIRSVTGKLFRPDKTTGFNNYDMYVNNITEYGKPVVRFEYKGPGSLYDNGFVIDYIEFIPVED